MDKIEYIAEFPLPDGKIKKVKYKSKATAINGVCIAGDHYLIFGNGDFTGVVYEKNLKTEKKRLVFEINEKRR